MSIVLYTVDGLPYGAPFSHETGPEYEARMGLQGCRVFLANCFCNGAMQTLHAVRPDNVSWCLRCGKKG